MPPVSVTKIDHKEILTVENQIYPEVLAKYTHPKGVHIAETATKKELSINIILGAEECTKIMLAGYQRVGKIGGPVAEQIEVWVKSGGESGNSGGESEHRHNCL